MRHRGARRRTYQSAPAQEELRKAVARQVKAGLRDDQVAAVLGVAKSRVREVREELGLPRNARGPE